MSVRMIPEGHVERICLICGGENIGWYAPNKVWNKVMGEDKYRLGVVCPHCFTSRAKKIGITIWFKAESGINVKEKACREIRGSEDLYLKRKTK